MSDLAALQDVWREFPLRLIVYRAESRKRWIFRALAKILSLSDTIISDPIAGMASFQSAVNVPFPLDAMGLVFPKVTLLPNASLILIQPPFKSVAFPAL